MDLSIIGALSLPQMKHTDELGGFQLLEIRSSLPDELLMYADKLSMAHSLELRVPYLDRTVVEYVQRLGANLKIRAWHPEMASPPGLPTLFAAAHPQAKEARLCRQCGGCLVSVLRAGTTSPSCFWTIALRCTICSNAEPVRKLLSDHRSGRQDNHKLLFSLVMVEQWLREPSSEKVLQPATTR